MSGPYAMTRIIEDNHPTLCVFVTGSSVIVSYPTTSSLPRKYVSIPREDRHFPPSGMRNVSEWPRRERNLP